MRYIQSKQDLDNALHCTGTSHYHYIYVSPYSCICIWVCVCVYVCLLIYGPIISGKNTQWTALACPQLVCFAFLEQSLKLLSLSSTSIRISLVGSARTQRLASARNILAHSIHTQNQPSKESVLLQSLDNLRSLESDHFRPLAFYRCMISLD